MPRRAGRHGRSGRCLALLVVGATAAAPARLAAAPGPEPTQPDVGIQQTLSITVPTGAVHLGDAAPGAEVSGQLGAVTVTDGRLLGLAWTVTVTATGFTTGGATAPETIPRSQVRYWSGPATQIIGLGIFVPGQPEAADAVTLDTTRTAFSHPLGVAANEVTWSPTVVVHLPAQAVGGRYTGNVIHSVL